MTKKDRIMDLMRKGVITEDEALELLEKSDESAADRKAFSYTDKKGYDNHEMETGDQIKSALNQIGEGLKNAFGVIKKNVDETIDFSKGFPKIRTVDHQSHYELKDSFDRINLDMKAGKVKIKSGQVAEAQVEYKVYGSVGEEGIEAYLTKNAQFEIVDGTLQIVTRGRLGANIELTLPKKVYDSIELDLTHGEVAIDHLETQHFSHQQVNGKMNLSHSQIGHLDFSGKNNSLTLDQNELGQVIIDNLNGEIVLSSNFEDAEISNINGGIKITQKSNKARKLAAKTVNGDIKLSVPESLGLVGHVQTVFGGYKTKLALDTPLETGKNGGALIRKKADSLTFDLSVKSGTIWLKDNEGSDSKHGKSTDSATSQPEENPSFQAGKDQKSETDSEGEV